MMRKSLTAFALAISFFIPLTANAVTPVSPDDTTPATSEEKIAKVETLKTRAAEGDPEAQFELGRLYLFGEHITRDAAKAAELFTASAEQGYAPAQHNLALLYAHGDGVEQDHVRAVEWHRKAIDQNLAESQYELGVMYTNGHGVPKDDAMAYMLISLAAEQGLPVAAHMREPLAEVIPAKQLARGQKLLKEWHEKHSTPQEPKTP